MRSAFRFGCALAAAALACPAAGSPLSTQPEQPPRLTPAEAAQLDNEQRVLRAAMPGEDVDLLDLAGSRTRPAESQWLLGEGGDRDSSALRGRSFQDQLRGLANVERADPRPSAGVQPRGRGEASPFGPELSLAATDWVRDITQSLLHSTLRVEPNERGQTVFSVLGVGEFGVSVAGDRSAITLSAGDDALFSLQRVPRPEPHGFRGAPGDGAPSSPGGRDGSQLRLQQMLEEIGEAASHPLSLLVYCLILGYLLLWALLDRRRTARVRSRTRSRAVLADSPPADASRQRTRRRRHRRPETRTEESAARESEPQASSTPRRKRVRMRVRVRVRKRLWRRSS